MRVLIAPTLLVALFSCACGSDDPGPVPPRVGDPYFRMYTDDVLTETLGGLAYTVYGTDLTIAAMFPTEGDVDVGVSFTFSALLESGDERTCRVAPEGTFTLGPDEAIVSYGPELGTDGPLSDCLVTAELADEVRVKGAFAFEAGSSSVRGEFDLDVNQL